MTKLTVDTILQHEKADCSLYLEPIISSSAINQQIVDAVLRAYEQGQGIDSVVKALSSDENISKYMSNELQEYLSFQQQKNTENASATLKRLQGETLSEYEARVASLEEQATLAQENYSSQIKVKKQEIQSNSARLTVMQREVDELKETFSSTLSEKDAQTLSMLLDINDEVLGSQKVRSAKKVIETLDSKMKRIPSRMGVDSAYARRLVWAVDYHPEQSRFSFEQCYARRWKNPVLSRVYSSVKRLFS